MSPPQHTVETRWFHFSQNNSGGDFVEDDQLSHHVIIEAVDAAQANTRAESIGIYFDGVAAERDCECCGDRWYPQDTEGRYTARGTKVPRVHNTPAAECVDMFCDLPVRVHHLDGRIEKLGRKGPWSESDAINKKYYGLDASEL